jgi:hypothetical protein
MAKHQPNRPRDPNQLGKLIVDIATGEACDAPDLPESASVEFARSGGLKGGAARAASLTPKRRQEIARQAAKQRWSAKKKK